MMNREISESVWMNGMHFCHIEHMVEVSGLSVDEIEDLIAHDVISPVNPLEKPYSFALHYVLIAKKARRLRDDFSLDSHGITLALTLLNRISELENELIELKAKSGN
jgi:chaperone modulatory protein CbpM